MTTEYTTDLDGWFDDEDDYPHTLEQEDER